MENKNWMNNRFWFYAFTILIVLILIAIIYVFTSITDSSKPVNESNEQRPKISQLLLIMKNYNLL